MNETSTIANVFKERILQIPDYQRGYSWERRQWDDFLSDLEVLPEGRNHYTGTLVLHPQPSPPCLDEEGNVHHLFHVVDGQQRLTTIVLLLDAIRRALVGRDAKGALARNLEKQFIAVTDTVGKRLFKLQLNRDARDYWERSVLADQPAVSGPAIRSQRQLAAARNHFSAYLDARGAEDPDGYEAWLVELFLKITQRLQLSVYTASDAAEVGVIFEVMNNRGKPLSELEKVKNYLLYLASKVDIEEGRHRAELVERINATWTNVLKRFMRADLVKTSDEDQLLRAHWLVCYDPTAKSWSGSRSIKALFDLRSYWDAGVVDHAALVRDLTSYLTTLDDASAAFCDAFAPGGPGAFAALTDDRQVRRDIAEWSLKLHRIGVLAPFLPLLVAARLSNPTDGPAYLDLLRLCEHYAFRVYRMRERRSNAGASALYRLAHDLWKGRVDLARVKDRIGQIRAWYQKDKEYEAWWVHDGDDAEWYGWGGLKYLLYEYELHLAQGREVKLTWSEVSRGNPKTTIEHVLPQTPKDEYWKSRFTKKQRKALLHDLGNLCLTQDNSSYSNKPFTEKRGHAGATGRCYARAFTRQELELCEFEEWTPDSIAERRERIFAWARDRWAMAQVVADMAIHLDDDDTPAEEPEVEVEDNTTTRRTIRWSDLAQRYPDLIATEVALTLSVGGESIEAFPSFLAGRGKCLVLADGGGDLRDRLLGRLDSARGQCLDWEVGALERAADLLQESKPVPMSNLTLLLQRALSDPALEPDWQAPSSLWRTRDGRTVEVLQQSL